VTGIRNNLSLEFHTSADARKKYSIDENLFTLTGDLIVAHFDEARKLSYEINEVRKSENRHQELTSPGQVNALGIIHEIFHFLIGYYTETINPGAFSRGLKHLNQQLGTEATDKVLLNFIEEFPPLDVYKGKIKPEEYLISATSNKSNRELLIEEIILLHLQNINPAASKLSDLYDDKSLAGKTKYLNLLDETENFFISEKYVGQENLPLIQFLRKPIVSNPYDLEGQLDFIFREWGVLILDKFGKRLLGGKDLIHEDYKLFIQHGGGEKGTPPVPSYEFDEEYFKKLKARLEAGEHLTADELIYYQSEYEKFTSDIAWMPRVVMLAKNTHVWLDQLSKKYQRSISRLDQIPDEELDNIARWNFTALWLIGIWERSSASRKIKHLTGNPEAVSSAYSLFDYIIANDLGGEGAFNNLKERAARRGIRMASDMVPNHTGIYSKWVVEKPYYFIQRNEPPYPSYSFHGPDLSDDERVAVRIEDKYYSRSDAAVVFQRIDKYTGDVKYIYHGNDGTNMPWNDTAQLNLLIPEVRESLYQTIKHVAALFPIIRFDAAMTLSKKHFQRLWFPNPGTAGAVPSRAEYAMTREQFDNEMPDEFWREVVDRMNAEMPDTLLLAEAFWLMEGYFVRTLGMHRVYNSAFMHMLMKEENEKYRMLVKNTLEFNPEILKRYVNFMSNPDEETAVNQFGKGDKYFGVCVTMITMPGLPMFGHGQIEGFSEKYGMEYQRAYYNEFVDDNLVRTHEDQIFPLMKKRYLFSQVENFEFFDFVETSGTVNESVFAYSNRYQDDRALVLYNNSYQESRGSIKYSVGKSDHSASRTKSLAEALNLKADPNIYYVFKDYHTRFEYLASGSGIFNDGRQFYLKGYEYVVLMDFREVYDNDGTYAKLYDYLQDKGVYSVETALREMTLAPIRQAITSLFEPPIFNAVKALLFGVNEDTLGEQFRSDLYSAVDEFNKFKGVYLDKIDIENHLDSEFASSRTFNRLLKKKSLSKRKLEWFEEAKNSIVHLEENNNAEFSKNILAAAYIVGSFQHFIPGPGSIWNKFLLDRIIPPKLKLLSPGYYDSNNHYDLIKVLSDPQISSKWKQGYKFFDTMDKRKKDYNKSFSPEAEDLVRELFENIEFRNFIEVHEYQNIEYFNKEKFEAIIDYIFTLYNLNSPLKRKSMGVSPKIKSKGLKLSDTALEKYVLDELKLSYEFFNRIKSIASEKKYMAAELIKALKSLSQNNLNVTLIKKSENKIITKRRGRNEKK
jgi:glycosidase